MIRRLPFSQDDAKKDPEQYKNLLYGSWRCRQTAVHVYGGIQVKTTFNSYFNNNYHL